MDLNKPCCGVPPRVPGYYDRPYFEQRDDAYSQDPGLREFMRTTAWFPVWDDHEVSDNWAGRADATGGKGRGARANY